jgi:hypothetical protein
MCCLTQTLIHNRIAASASALIRLCCFRDCLTGVALDNAESVRIDECSFLGMAHAGLTGGGRGGSLDLNDCTFEGSMFGRRHEEDGMVVRTYGLVHIVRPQIFMRIYPHINECMRTSYMRSRDSWC